MLNNFATQTPWEITPLQKITHTTPPNDIARNTGVFNFLPGHGKKRKWASPGLVHIGVTISIRQMRFNSIAKDQKLLAGASSYLSSENRDAEVRREHEVAKVGLHMLHLVLMHVGRLLGDMDSWIGTYG